MRTQPPMLSLLCALAMTMALRALKGPESLLPPALPCPLCRCAQSASQRNARGHQARLHPKVRDSALSRCPYPPFSAADRGKGRLGGRPAIAPWAALIALKSIATMRASATRCGISACAWSQTATSSAAWRAAASPSSPITCKSSAHTAGRTHPLAPSPPRPRPSCWPTGHHAMPMTMRTCAAGVRLRSGRELPADVIVTATGLNMVDISALVPACV